MAEEVQIISTLDNTKTLKALTETEKQVNKNTEALLGANEAAMETFNTIVADSKAAQNSLKSLQETSERLTEEIENTQRGTARYKELKQELINVNKEIKNVELSFEALDSEQVASEVGSVVGGLTDVASGAFLTLGVAEESAEEFFQTLAKVEGAGRLVKGSIEGIQSAAKLYNNVIKSGNLLQQANAVTLGAVGAAQSAYTAIVGTSTGALKLFRLALIGTGIGAIVVAIGLLISNFDKVKEVVGKVVDSFLPLKLAIEGVIALLEELGIIQSEEAQLALKAAEDRVEALGKEKGAIEDRYDFEIAKAKAAGKDTKQLEQEKRTAVLENIKEQAKAIRSLVLLTGEFTDEQKEQFQELTDQAKKLSQERVVADIEATKEANDKAAEAAKKRREAAEKAAKEEADKLAAIAQELANLRIAAIEDETERELALLDQKFDDRITKLKEGGAEEIELAVALEEEKARQVAAVQDKAEKERKAKEEEAAKVKAENDKLLIEADFANRQALAEDEAARLALENEQKLADESAAFEERKVALQERGLLTQELEAEIERARLASLANIQAEFDAADQERQEQLRLAEIDREEQKRNAKIAIAASVATSLGSIASSVDELGIKSAGVAKGVAVAQIAINTAQAISGAVAAGSKVPFPGNIPAIISGISAVLAGIVSAKKALAGAKVPGGGGGGGGIPSPSIPAAVAGAGGGIPATPAILGEPGEGGTGGDTQAAGGNQIVKAFVVETEVTDAQANARNIEEKSELT